ncbi:hypothetical protein BGW80DRAFT_1512309 [Lactifluus volemus]|nr:hypothetical protein BGW80DRAFT_1512309 [Lactifluus volemus]
MGVYVRPIWTYNSPTPTNRFLTTAELLVTAVPMSAGGQETNPMSSNFALIFNAALKDYKKLTKKDIYTEQSIAQLDGCDSPRGVLDVFQNQAQAFEEFRKGDTRLIAWLEPTVDILSILSQTLGEALALVSPAKMIFKGIGLLLTHPQAAKNVAAGHNMLLNIFEHIKCFLERLKIYINIPLTTATGMIELLGNIMAQVLSVLAISTKAMAECRITQRSI